MKINLLLLACFFALAAAGQDPQFTQPQFAPLHFSPAQTGFLQGKFQHRVNVKYRDQWWSALGQERFKTLAASYDFRLCGKESFGGFGISVVNQQAGEPRFSTSQVQAAGAFHQRIGYAGFLSGGMSAGAVNFRFETDGLNFQEQFDGYGGFDPNRPSQENLPDEPSEWLFDLGAGLRFQHGGDWKNNPVRFGFEAGLAVHHVNRPVFTFFNEAPASDEQAQLGARWVAHLGVNMPFDGGSAAMFRVVRVAQELAGDSPHRQTLLKVDFRKSMSKTALTLGFGARLAAGESRADALLATAQVSLNEKLTLGAAWDFNVSPLRRATQGQGAVEVSVTCLFWENRDCVDCGTF